jgi:hypothetical protein
MQCRKVSAPGNLSGRFLEQIYRKAKWVARVILILRSLGSPALSSENTIQTIALIFSGCKWFHGTFTFFLFGSPQCPTLPRSIRFSFGTSLVKVLPKESLLELLKPALVFALQLTIGVVASCGTIFGIFAWGGVGL